MYFDFDDTYKQRLADAIATGQPQIVMHRIRKEENMKVVLPDGTAIEGTLEQIQRVAQALGQRVPNLDDGVHYHSSSKGLVRIDSMETTHLRNALLARYRAFVSDLSNKPTVIVAAEIQSPSDKTLVGLMGELVSRLKRGRI